VSDNFVTNIYPKTTYVVLVTGTRAAIQYGDDAIYWINEESWLDSWYRDEVFYPPKRF